MTYRALVWPSLVLAGSLLLSGCNSGSSSSDASLPAAQTVASHSAVERAAKSTPSLAVYFGKLGSAGYVNATSTAAKFNFPFEVAADSHGNVFVTDGDNSVIRQISANGAVTLIAGVPGQTGYQDGPLATALFNVPEGIVVDSVGNIFVADVANNVIRKISIATGMVSTFAGSVGSYGSSDGTGSNASFNSLLGLTIDSKDNLYVTDVPAVRTISPAAVVTTLQYTPSPTFYPLAVAVDNLGNLFLTSADNTIAELTPNGTFTTIAGTSGVTGNVDGPGSTASFDAMLGIAADAFGHVFVTDSNDDVRMVTVSTQEVTTIAGVANQTGRTAGVRKRHFFNDNGIALGLAGVLYVADSDHNVIRALSPQQKGDGKNAHTVYTVSTLAGTQAQANTIDGDKSSARFEFPGSMAYDSSGNLWIVDTGANTIREIMANGQTRTVAGTANATGSADGTGAAASFNFDTFGNGGITILPNGSAAVADYGNNTIRIVTAQGVVTTLAGTAGVYGASDGTGAAASFCEPTGLASDGQGNIYVADSCAQEIRVVTPAGVVTTLAGTPFGSGSADGNGSAAQFSVPMAVTLGLDGALYVADSYNGTIRRVTLTGDVTTVAGTAGIFGASDGIGAAASFHWPEFLVTSPSGTIYISDADDEHNNLIRTFVPSTGIVTTLVGTKSAPAGFVAGPLPGNIVWPHGLAISGTDLYIGSEQGVAVAKNVVQ